MTDEMTVVMIDDVLVIAVTTAVMIAVMTAVVTDHGLVEVVEVGMKVLAAGQVATGEATGKARSAGPTTSHVGRSASSAMLQGHRTEAISSDGCRQSRFLLDDGKTSWIYRQRYSGFDCECRRLSQSQFLCGHWSA